MPRPNRLRWCLSTLAWASSESENCAVTETHNGGTEVPQWLRLRREPLCQKGLFFICPTPVYNKIAERLGGNVTEIHQQAGSVSIMWCDMWYDVAAPVPNGQIRRLEPGGQATTKIDQVALAFTAPGNLPPAKVYEPAIIAEL